MKFNEKDVEYTIECLEEWIPVEGNASVIDPETDKEIADEIYRQLESGNQWAWCRVKVTASWNGFEGTDYLGACSYASEAEFKAGGYYADMKSVALDDLIATIANVQKRVCGVEL